MTLTRRSFLASLATTSAAISTLQLSAGQAKAKTDFQLACMTLPYSQFPLERALQGIKSSGFEYVAWGTTHKDGAGKPIPVLAADAPLEEAKQLGKRCRDLGL